MTDKEPITQFQLGGMKFCPIQELCQEYTTGDNKPPNHHLRITLPCKLFLDFSCEESVRIQIFLGKDMSCDIEKVNRIRKGLKGG